MARPRKCRWIWAEPNASYFKPRGIPLVDLDEVILTVDEHETIRLNDLLGLEQDQAALQMKISRQTFGRILTSARKKIADALINAKALKIEGGDFMVAKRKFRCSDCGHTWELAYGTGRPVNCPSCQSKNLHRAEEDRGYARAGRRGGGGYGGPRNKTL
jgi:predicted DNA-binding protein (UPF0251 family)